MDITNIVISVLMGNNTIIADWGYIGIFLTSLISSAAVLPFPGFVVVFSFARTLNPVALGFAAALGSALGSLTSYLIGLGGKELLEKKYEDKLQSMEKTFEKYGAFLWIFLVNVLPIPDNLMSAFVGIIRYDFRKYFLAMFLGKLTLNLLICFAGYYSMGWVADYFHLQSYITQTQINATVIAP